jgi:hypothetical protein
LSGFTGRAFDHMERAAASRRWSAAVLAHLSHCQEALRLCGDALAATLAAARDPSDDLWAVAWAAARRDAALRMRHVKSAAELSGWQDELLARVGGGPAGATGDDLSRVRVAADAEAISMLRGLPW